MAKFDSGLFHGTSGSPQTQMDVGGEAPSSSGTANTLPANSSQLSHMFGDREGHLPDTAENRALIEGLANDPGCYIGTDQRGNEWYARNNPDGSQIWASVRNGVVQNCGENSVPHIWDPRTGLSANPLKNL